MTLETAIKKDLHESVKKLVGEAYMLGYKRAKNEIVQCKDCKYFHHSGECILFKSRMNVVDKGGDGFCAWAEREEE